MHSNDKANFYRLISDALGYYRQDASEFALSVWWAGCAPFSFEQVSKALTAHATDPDKGQFAPKVADVVRQLAGTKTDRSLLAWGRVHDAMSQVGAYQDVDFGDNAIHAAIMDLGGWVKLCRTDLKDLGYTQHRFCESYRAYQAAGTSEIVALMGDRSPDGMYAKRGIAPPKPVRIAGGKELPKAQIATEKNPVAGLMLDVTKMLKI
jgi:Domain of unknown function (DUF6475)